MQFDLGTQSLARSLFAAKATSPLYRLPSATQLPVPRDYCPKRLGRNARTTIRGDQWTITQGIEHLLAIRRNFVV